MMTETNSDSRMMLTMLDFTEQHRSTLKKFTKGWMISSIHTVDSTKNILPHSLSPQSPTMRNKSNTFPMLHSIQRTSMALPLICAVLAAISESPTQKQEKSSPSKAMTMPSFTIPCAKCSIRCEVREKSLSLSNSLLRTFIFRVVFRRIPLEYRLISGNASDHKIFSHENPLDRGYFFPIIPLCIHHTIPRNTLSEAFPFSEGIFV